MEVLLIVLVAFVGYLIAYNTYGRFLAKKDEYGWTVEHFAIPHNVAEGSHKTNLNKALSDEFRKSIAGVKNPYGVRRVRYMVHLKGCLSISRIAFLWFHTGLMGFQVRMKLLR